MDTVSYRARADKRREKRFAAEVGAMLHWDGVSQPVTIRNISIYGALVTGIWLPTIGERVTLIADGLEVWATVIWKRPDRCGLLLSHAIDPLAVIAESRLQRAEHPSEAMHYIGTDGHA